MSHSKPPANSPNPQPVPKDVPPAYKPIKWSFPFVPAGKDDAGSPMTYMKALGSAEDGFFPLGVNGMWHGGIHFGHGTAQLLKQDEGIRAIADGEIVAYRLNRRYPEFQYDDHKWALYSTGFVLIRHRLQLPPSPKKNGSTPARTAAPADEQMTFFSLYMHLLDWDGYQAAVQQAKASPADAAKPTMAPMKYWDGDRWYRVGNTAKDLQEVPKPVPRPPVTDPDPLQRLLDPDYTPPPQPPAPPEPPPPPPIAGVRVFDAANGRAIGLLPRGAELTVGPEKDGWARIATMKSGQPVGPVAGQPASTNVACGWVNLKSLELIVNPRSFDQVVVLKSPVSVDAGEVVGYLGHYLRHGDATLLPAKRTRPLVHLEVFAGADLPAFIAKSKARGAELKEQTFLEIQPGAQLVTKVVDATPLMLKPGLKLAPVGDAQGAAWVLVQPKLITAAPAAHGKHKGHQKPRETAEGKPVWVESNLANQTTTGQERGWLDFPPSLSTASGPAAEFRDVFRRTDLDALGQGRVAKDSQGRCWWYITLANKDGGTVDGWVCEKDHRLTQWCGPWDWPGFEQIDGSSHTPLDLLRRYLFTRQLILADEDQEKFKASALEVNEGPLIKQLTKAIDANHDGNVTAQELARAQQVQWSAEAISHLVVRCESEWGGGMGKWDSLSPLMQRLLSHWKSEMQRIETLQWWDSAKGIEGFPQDTKPWHFHPIGLVGNFVCDGGDCVPLLDAQKISMFISGAYENHNPDFAGVAGNFDGMGMSFGVIQWNFGSGTLGPLLMEMHDVDPQAFEGAFGPGTNFQKLWGAIVGKDVLAQKSWAIEQQSVNKENWQKAFRTIGANEKFINVQIREACKVHGNIVSCLQFLRELEPDLMARVQLVTYCALYDLCVQQNNLNRSAEEIRRRVRVESPRSQIDLLKIAVQERAKKADPKWVFDCTSRRMGIIQQKPFPHAPVPGEKPSPRDNVNFKLLAGRAEKYVCGL